MTEVLKWLQKLKKDDVKFDEWEFIEYISGENNPNPI
jgi:hypothetical protein